MDRSKGLAVCLVILAHASGALSARELLGTKCPPRGFNALAQLDLASYISAPWYVQYQMPVTYQPKNELYCVRATYEANDASDLLKGLLVKNYANKGRVNGPAVGTDGDDHDDDIEWLTITAKIKDRNQPAKLRVGPKILGWDLPDALRGDYWVVAAGTLPDSDNTTSPEPAAGTTRYDWAIITGGSPGTSSNGACKTGSKWSWVAKHQVNNIGFWLFSRRPVDPVASAAMMSIAQGLGLDTKVLVKVQQEGCLYAD